MSIVDEMAKIVQKHMKKRKTLLDGLVEAWPMEEGSGPESPVIVADEGALCSTGLMRKERRDSD